MRIRLFWKILFGFWLTFLGIMEALWLAFTLYGNPPRPLQEAELSARMQIGALAAVVQSGGADPVRSVLATWPEDRRAAFDIAPLPGNASQTREISEADGKLLAEATDSKGAHWRLSYDLAPVRARFAPRG